MMQFVRLENRIKHDEGFRLNPYLDTVGVPTIGFGTTRILGKPVALSDPPISKDTARALLRSDLYGALIDAQKVLPNFNELNCVRQEVLVNMAYNLGARGLKGFKKFLAALSEHDYRIASQEMVSSTWYGQVGTRAQRLRGEMLHGIITKKGTEI